METEALMRQLEGMNISLSGDILSRIERFESRSDSGDDELNGKMILQGDVMPPHPREIESWSPEYRHKEVFFKECAVAGLSFHLEKDDELWDELEVGTKLALVRDRHNKYDSNAVAVALADDYDGNPDDFDFDFILGYIPKSDNAELAAMMDAGYADKFSARITAYKRYGNYNERIRLTIFILSNEPGIVRPDLLRAQSLSCSELREMVDELADSSINIVVRAWTHSSNYWGLYYEMNERFYKELPEHGFSFPFPQMDVHIADVPDSIKISAVSK